VAAGHIISMNSCYFLLYFRNEYFGPEPQRTLCPTRTYMPYRISFQPPPTAHASFVLGQPAERERGSRLPARAGTYYRV